MEHGGIFFFIFIFFKNPHSVRILSENSVKAKNTLATLVPTVLYGVALVVKNVPLRCTFFPRKVVARAALGARETSSGSA